MKDILKAKHLWLLIVLALMCSAFSTKLLIIENIIKNPKMVEIEGGTFIMGQNNGEGDEKPEHLVEIKDFYIAKFEITVAEYRKFCNATKRDMPKKPEWGWIDNHPIINTSWNDAIGYIEWLNEKTHQDYRLPTEAEFEYVIRNGGEPGVYPWGELQPTNENLADETYKSKTSRSRIWENYQDSFAFTAPVGSFEPNKLGVCDINGNIWEWCSDWYGAYSNQKMIDPQGPISGKNKVGRGASYDADPWHSRSASRAFVEPDFKRPGFRLALNKK
ncbi:formylglycine-generating enzyme family protein [Sediminicola sp. YIK13]|uniref:formylglycine-generating enzyme family protein n=1 Tax=Sediminicola sp. YIK13 TaxID=1453352 RepID=UPI0009E9594D|nr:SUMF1/EgtB/PvdO family nonheme iron enzyme [Sediminicola sp. YIK13]